jgi:hypothetical protein
VCAALSRRAFASTVPSPASSGGREVADRVSVDRENARRLLAEGGGGDGEFSDMVCLVASWPH